MSHDKCTFVDLCLSGEVLAEEIEDFVGEWHEGTGDLPIYTFLGMTWDEYALWVEKPAALEVILEARKRGGAISQYWDDTEYRMAARSVSADDVEDLVEWLKRTGRIPS